MQQQKPSLGVIKLRITVASCSDTGRVREHNEDAIAFCEPSDQTLLAQVGRLYLLADGAGGHAAGEVASRTAVETIAVAYYDQTGSGYPLEHVPQPHGEVKHLHGPLGDLDTPFIQIQRAFFAAHTRIHQLGTLKQEYSGMLTTCLAAVVKNNRLLIAHVGDSRAYLIRPMSGSPPAITRLTSDHSLVTELARAGIISPEQMQSSSSRHVILRALGGQKPDYAGPDITTCIVQAGEYLLLCCDGLWSLLTEEQIARVVCGTTPQKACDELIWLANEAGGKDNVSVILLSFM